VGEEMKNQVDMDICPDCGKLMPICPAMNGVRFCNNCRGTFK